MKKFNKAAFMAGASFPTKEAEVEGLGVFTIRQLSARSMSKYIEAGTGKNAKGDFELSIDLIQMSAVNDEGGLLFSKEETKQMFDSFTGSQVQALVQKILVLNKLAVEEGETEKK